MLGNSHTFSYLALITTIAYMAKKCLGQLDNIGEILWLIDDAVCISDLLRIVNGSFN